MPYYVFETQNEDGSLSYGFIPGDKVAPENLESIEGSAFAILEELPPVTAELDGKEYALAYDDATEEFSWVVVRDLTEE